MEVELQGQIYRIGRLNAFQQWHVFRRIVPLFGSFSGISPDQDMVRLAMLNTLMPAFEAIKNMSDADTDMVLQTCLGAVHRKDKAVEGGWVRITTDKNILMFEDINMTVMIRLTIYVIMENLSDFFTQAASEDSTGAGAGE